MQTQINGVDAVWSWNQSRLFHYTCWPRVTIQTGTDLEREQMLTSLHSEQKQTAQKYVQAVVSRSIDALQQRSHHLLSLTSVSAAEQIGVVQNMVHVVQVATKAIALM